MFYVFGVIVVYTLFVVFYCNAGPTQISTGERNFRNDANIPSMHMTLLSIEDRLKSLENSVEGKIEFYGRKIDNIEKDLSRFQVYMRMELDKISENISNKNYKDDFIKDRTIRKIETIYERINHRLTSIEGQIDIANMKSQNTREMLTTKLEKMEESLTIRDADMEAEIAEAVAAIDDLKSTCTNIEENIINSTRDFTRVLYRNSEKLNKKHHSQVINAVELTNRTLTENLANIRTNLNFLLNESSNNSYIMQTAKNELDESLNDYANKISDMYSDLWKKSEDTHETIENLSKVANLTRNEQQNGLRALMVQIGRKTSKNVQSDSSLDNQKLIELSEKIDSNFENIMLAQNLFLESCHRVQMDESQIESQISMVLNKLIDVFQNKTSVGPKDIEQLEQLIRTHDSNIRRSIYHITNNLLALMQKTTDGKVEIIDYINNQRLQLESIYVLIQHTLSLNDSEKIQNILDGIQDLQQQLNEIYYETRATTKQTNITNNLLGKLFNETQDTFQINNIKLKHVFEFIKNIYHILTSIEMKVNKSYLDYYFNKFNIEAIAHRFGKKLHEYIKHVEATNITNSSEHITLNSNSNTTNIQQLILEIFGEQSSKSHATINPYDDHPYTMINSNDSHSEDEIHNVVLLCINSTNRDCDRLNHTKYEIINHNETEYKPPKNTTNKCENGGKLNSLECESESFDELSSSHSVENENKTASSTGCLPDYVGLIDVRSNYDRNCTKMNVTENLNATGYEGNENITYGIDVRFNNLTKTINTTLSANELVVNDTSTSEEEKIENEITTSEIVPYTISSNMDELVETTTTDENYVGIEDESAELNQEFEYTNHEYV